MRSAIVGRSVLAAAGLLLVVACGCRPSSSDAGQETLPQVAAKEEVAQAAETPAAQTTATAPAQTDEHTRVIAYYFHYTLRCATCLSIEAQARAAVEMGYAQELKDGRVEWQAVNIDEPDNKHFEQDFELGGSSLVLVEMNGADIVRWTVLGKVWDLVDDEAGFQEYVWTELALYVGS